jgi:hypothetical protein
MLHEFDTPSTDHSALAEAFPVIHQGTQPHEVRNYVERAAPAKQSPTLGPRRVRTARQYRYVLLHLRKSEVLEDDGSFQLLQELLLDGWVPVRESPMGASGGAHSHAWALVLLTKER